MQVRVKLRSFTDLYYLQEAQAYQARSDDKHQRLKTVLRMFKYHTLGRHNWSYCCVGGQFFWEGPTILIDTHSDTPVLVTVTTRFIIFCRLGDPYDPLLPTVSGGGSMSRSLEKKLPPSQAILRQLCSNRKVDKAVRWCTVTTNSPKTWCLVRHWVRTCPKRWNFIFLSNRYRNGITTGFDLQEILENSEGCFGCTDFFHKLGRPICRRSCQSLAFGQGRCDTPWKVICDGVVQHYSTMQGW